MSQNGEEEKPADAAPAEDENKAEEDDALLNNTHDSLHREVENAELCCCCICHCSTEKTRDLSCFGCFPIKCAIIGIGINTICLVVFAFCEIFYLLLNEYVKWWYVLVACLLLVPAIIGCCFLVVFFNRDNHSSRGKLFVACMFVIISFSLVGIWNLCYFNFWYKEEDVIIGSEHSGYLKQTKKQYIFWSLFITCVIDGFYAYFICVCKFYYNRLREAPPPKEDEEKKDEAAAEEAKPEGEEAKPAEGEGEAAAAE